MCRRIGLRDSCEVSGQRRELRRTQLGLSRKNSSRGPPRHLPRRIERNHTKLGVGFITSPNLKIFFRSQPFAIEGLKRAVGFIFSKMKKTGSFLRIWHAICVHLASLGISVGAASVNRTQAQKNARRRSERTSRE